MLILIFNVLVFEIILPFMLNNMKPMTKPHNGALRWRYKTKTSMLVGISCSQYYGIQMTSKLEIYTFMKFRLEMLMPSWLRRDMLLRKVKSKHHKQFIKKFVMLKNWLPNTHNLLELFFHRTYHIAMEIISRS